MGNKILACVVTYNRKALLRECISALLAQSVEELDILIIDNASTDGTREMIADYHNPHVLYTNTGNNWGPAIGFMYAVNMAIVGEYKYCWLMDDDTIPEASALRSLLDNANFLKDEFSFLASIVKWTDGSSCPFNRQRIASNYYDYMPALENGLLAIPSSSYTSCFIHVDIAKKVGLPLGEYYIYADDVEYTARLSTVKQGYLDINSVAVHKMSSIGNANVWHCSEDRIERFFYAYRNVICTARRKGKGAVWHILWKDLKDVAKILLRAKNKKWRREKALLYGVFSGFFFNPPIVKEYSVDFFKKCKGNL